MAQRSRYFRVGTSRYDFTRPYCLFPDSCCARAKAYLPSKDDDVEALLAEQLADGELSAEDRQALEDGEALDEIKAKLKPKKSAISADMLDTANSYDDKVAIVRLLVAEDAGRVANVLKKMIKPA